MGTLTARPGYTDSIALWTKRITECKTSGMTTSEWCTENGIGIKTYYYWHKKIHKMVNEQQAAFYEVPVSTGPSGSPAATIRIGTMQADIFQGADAETIKAICQAMKTC